MAQGFQGVFRSMSEGPKWFHNSFKSVSESLMDLMEMSGAAQGYQERFRGFFRESWYVRGSGGVIGFLVRVDGF